MSTHQERVLILHTDDKQVFIRYALLLTKYQLLSTIFFFLQWVRKQPLTNKLWIVKGAV